MYPRVVMPRRAASFRAMSGVRKISPCVSSSGNESTFGVYVFLRCVRLSVWARRVPTNTSERTYDAPRTSFFIFSSCVWEGSRGYPRVVWAMEKGAEEDMPYL